jgi:hypothetical protein
MIIDTHTHVVSSDKATHPLDPGARGWSTEVSNDVEDLILEMDRAGVDCATLVQPNATYGLDNSYQCDSARLYAPRTDVGFQLPVVPGGGYIGQVQLGQTALPWLSVDDRKWIMGETAHQFWPLLGVPATA